MNSGEQDKSARLTHDREVLGEGWSKLMAGSFGVLCVSVFTIIQYNMAVGPKRLPSQIIRLFLTFFMLRATYKGSELAKWISVVLCSLGAFGCICIFFLFAQIDWLLRVALLANSASYVYYVAHLLLSKDVRAFLEYQRSKAKRDRASGSNKEPPV